jgi:hypothetical protein
MATYSIGITGADAQNPFIPNNLTLPDTSVRVGGESLAMQLNTPLLCKNPDGSSSYYTLDSTRSIPGVSRVLLKM